MNIQDAGFKREIDFHFIKFELKILYKKFKKNPKLIPHIFTT